eukprot:6858532-Alexandrium_andersonii.AAC.1
MCQLVCYEGTAPCRLPICQVLRPAPLPRCLAPAVPPPPRARRLLEQAPLFDSMGLSPVPQ